MEDASKLPVFHGIIKDVSVLGQSVQSWSSNEKGLYNFVRRLVLYRAAVEICIRGGAQMKAVLKSMKMKKNGIPEHVVPIFEDIVQQYEEQFGPNLVGAKYFNPEWDDKFSKALKEHLTEEQRFRLYETNGACNGAGADKERKVFALEYAHLALDERMALFAETFGRWKPVLKEDNTLTLTFKCKHGYYKCAKEGKYITPPPNVGGYFERCAGGRLYELQKALGIKLRIKSVDTSPLHENVSNPVKFVFEIVS